MANQEHLDILQQGVNVWNQWKKEHSDINLDLSFAVLNGAHLSYADLSYVNLGNADLNHANLSYANLKGISTGEITSFIRSFHPNIGGLPYPDLRGFDPIHAAHNSLILNGANLSGANLSGADLRRSSLVKADLSGANLSGANLSGANLSGTDLCNANLRRADLSEADLSEADLSEADLSRARVGWTTFGDRDLRVVRGLETVCHEGPSPLSINTIYSSEGHIPESFLQGTGIPDSFIDYMRSLVLAGKLFDYYTCFISYASKDQAFVEQLYVDLQNKGVRCWFAPKDIKVGDKFRNRIDEAIRIHDKLLLVLSEHSIASDWVEKEVETAFEKERLVKEGGEDRTILLPIRLDDTVMNTTQAWAADIRRVRQIGDFRQWKNDDDYKKALKRLLRELKVST